jgi:hypothetical protein
MPKIAVHELCRIIKKIETSKFKLKCIKMSVGIVTVTPGNIVAIKLGDDATKSRQNAFEVAKSMVISGFDPSEHLLVIPRTPFKPGTREHWPDKGLHITVAMDGRDMGSYIDKVSAEAMCLDGEEIEVIFDPSSVKLLEGVPVNDESCGCVYYLAIDVSTQTEAKMNELRARISLPPLDEKHRSHISIAGIAPVDGDMERFRREWCPPRPASGLPVPLLAFTRQATSIYI